MTEKSFIRADEVAEELDVYFRYDFRNKRIDGSRRRSVRSKQRKTNF